jgi:hypothetical protein
MFLEGVTTDPNASTNSTAGGSTSAYGSSVQGTIDQIEDLKSALTNFVVSTNWKIILENANKEMISLNDQALSLQRSMGGVAMGTNNFRERMYTAYEATLELGSSFKDVTDAVAGLAEGMGRIVNPSTQVLENIVELSKGTGASTKEISTLITEMTRFGGTQEEATKKIHELSVEARQAGLSAKSYLKEIGSNVKSVSGFGFKTGIDGMKNMVKQAMLLRTTVDKIGAKQFANNLLDPEKAIEAAANMQMLGGAVGKLADPFQLMHMAQSDMEGLQKELVNSTKAAFTFNKATGGFEASTEDLYRLRQQAQITGQNFDELLEAGKEASKMDYLKDKFDLGSMSEDTQSLVAGLAEIGKDGKVSIDIPGFKKIEADSAEQLKAQLQNADTQKALKDYQDKAAMSEKDLATAQMTITENQAKDVNIIKEAVIRNIPDRDKFLEDIKTSNESLGNSFKTAADKAAPVTAEGLGGLNQAAATGASKIAEVISATDEMDMENRKEELKKKKKELEEGKKVGDGFFPSSGAAIIKGRGEMYKTLPEDQIAVGTNLSNYLNQVGGGSGKLDINININGTVGGDSANNISKMFEDSRVKKQIMDTVLYNLNSYKKQQGVIA